MARKYQTIEQWIDECLSDKDKDKPCNAFALIHMGVPQKEVHTWPLDGKTHTAKGLSAIVMAKAEGFAQDLPGIQNFTLQAFFGTPEPQAWHPIRVINGEISRGGDFEISETPDARGLNAQLMRHLEAKEKLLVGFVSGVASAWAQERVKLYEELTESYTLNRELILKIGEQHHLQEMEKLKFQRATAERLELMQHAPALVNVLTGREVLPSEHADAALLDNIARKVKPEMVQQLVTLGIVPEQLAGPLMARIASVHQRDAAQKKALAEAVPLNSDPVKEVQGDN
jgi:hypothetical protein